MSNKSVLGIDVSKKTFDVFLMSGSKAEAGEFDNSIKGFKQLNKWLQSNGTEKVHACMEATGTYGKKLCSFLHEAGHLVSVVNPLRVRDTANLI